MRRVVKILTAGTLAFCLTIGVAYGDGTTTGATFTTKVSQKVVTPGSTFTVTVGLMNVPDLGAFQFMMKSTGGESGTITVENVVLDQQHPEYVFRGVAAINAVDPQQWRAGGAIISGTKSVESAHLATVTFRVSEDAAGTFAVNLDKGPETFLRDSGAAPIPVLIGKPATVTVSERALPSRVDKKKRG